MKPEKSEEDILTQMQGHTLTEGWDVINAMDAPRINKLFHQQYVNYLYEGDALPPINDTVQITETPNIQAQFVDVILGPPLITFSPSLDPQEALLSIPFLSGTVNLIMIDGDITTVLSSQAIAPAAGYTVGGVVPLGSVEGRVENSHDVVIVIENAGQFTAHLGFPEGAETTLGKYFLDLIKKNKDKFYYSLGTLIYDPNKTNLVPVKFDFATQIDNQDPTDQGRLILFIATLYNKGGGSQTSLAISNVIPSDYSTALIVSSEVLFKEIWLPQVRDHFSQYSITVDAKQATVLDAYELAATGGSLSAGKFGYALHDPEATEVWSTNKKGDSAAVEIQLNNIQIHSINETHNLQTYYNYGWKQYFAWCDKDTPRMDQWQDMSETVNIKYSGNVDSVKDVVSFPGQGGPKTGYPDPQGWWQRFLEYAGTALGEQISKAFNPLLEPIFVFQLPEVNAFAVSNLLFPQKHILSFKKVYIPGDLIIFGDIQTSLLVTDPLQVTLIGGETQQFTAQVGGEPQSVTWTVSGPGRISPDGLYSAPAVVTKPCHALVTAISTKDSTNYVSSLVILVPSRLMVAPYFVLLTPNEKIQFTAAMAVEPHQDVIWSMNPQVGALASDGTYTAPASIEKAQAVVITATSKDGKLKGTATVALLPRNPFDVKIDPFLAELSSSQIQEFSATVEGAKSNDVEWALIPERGTISDDGLYTAPDSIDEIQAVMVTATSKEISVLTGTAVVELLPDKE
ncbi:MAG: hypothetical protein HXS44_01470 [Theionarchaea archaeon]|nr:hypothetical protein [Theionarchaea archaeon]